MQSRSVPIGHGLQWISGGWQLFKRSPLSWIALTVTLLLIWLVLIRIPMLGPLLFNLLFPVFFAGMMIGCRALEQGKHLELRHLFAGFRENAAALVTVGGVYLVGMLVVMQLSFGSVESLPKIPANPTPEDVTALQTALQKLSGPILSATALLIPLMMFTWFAPLLIVFRKMPAFPALRTSFSACLQNIGAFTLYGIVIAVLWIAAVMPFMAGVVIVLPVLFASIYASYTDLFERMNEEPA